MTHKLIRTPRARLTGVAGAAAAGSLLLSSCGLGTSAGISPSGELGPKLASVKKLDGAEIAVGSKQFTEQQILGKIAVILLQSAGGNVKDFTTIPGSAAAREAQIQGQTESSQLGQIQIAGFPNPAGLQATGDNYLIETSASGAANLGAANEAGRGRIRQGALEASNVNVVEELVDMIETQRAYEVNSKMISATDEMLKYVNQNI